MKFEQALIPATLINRYKRFLADVRFDDGSETVVYCPNTGSMLNCATAGRFDLLMRLTLGMEHCCEKLSQPG